MKYIVALGSNINSQHAFDVALGELGLLGDVAVSSVVVGKDYTNKTDLMYHNAVLMITLYQPLPCNDFDELLKKIEIKCGRKHQSHPKQNHDDKHTNIPMDLDILAYHELSGAADQWKVIPKRMPFKQHEKKGIREVAPFLLTDL